MFGIPLMVLPHVITGTTSWWDDALLFGGALLVPVLALVLFRLGRWANKTGQEDEEEEKGAQKRTPNAKPAPKKQKRR